jgi:D-sedoheptulose 7-phosphate isomerase
MHTLNYFKKLNTVIDSINIQEFENAIEVIRTAWEKGSQIIVFGNGGSAMTALHYITDWNKMIYLNTGRQFKGRTLVDNIGIITAYSNDISYDDVFKEQLKNIGNQGDLVIAISGSGNSKNIINAVNYANENGMETLGLSGFNGGELKKIVKNSIWVNIYDMQIVEDIHMIFGHIVMQKFCKIK